MRRTQPTVEIDRLPPHSLESERGLLGSILLDPNSALPEARSRIPDAECFYDRRHLLLYETLCDMDDKRIPIDTITVQQRLRDSGSLESFGGITYLSELPDQVPTSGNLKFYLDTVLEKYQLRRALQFCVEQQRAIYESEGTAQEFLDGFEAGALKIRTTSNESKTHNMRDAVRAAIGMIEEYHERQGLITGISTGIHDLDKLTGGLSGGQMFVIAARPSVGKTALLCQIAEHVAIDQKLPVGIFSLEMSETSLALRMMCSRARVNLRNIRDGFMAERDFPKLTNAAHRLSGASLYVDDTPGLSITQLRARARRMHQQLGIRLFGVDYMQLLNAVVAKGWSREQAVAQLSTGVKLMARELNVPVIVLAQLNRSVEKDRVRSPRLSDIRESGQIEADSDLVGLLYHPSENEEDLRDEDAVPVNMRLGKNRNGPTGDVHLTFLKSYTRFEPRSKVLEDDVPERLATTPYPD